MRRLEQGGKTLLYLFVAVSCMFFSAKTFWKYEFKYAAPTPVPNNLRSIQINDLIDDCLAEPIASQTTPVFLHFFNPDCPCSRFNEKEFKDLVHNFGQEVDFKVVLQASESAAESFSKRYPLNVEVLVDKDGIIADQYGIYSTPQSVILESGGRIFYKGNYNKARFCTQPDSRFAFEALRHLLNDEPLPDFGVMATTAYGCNLPSDEAYLQEASLFGK